MMLRKDLVILVNNRDEWMGTAEKHSVHISGALHRALSIFLVNENGEMLLQQRALGKYHSAGLWTNACCSHPAPGEPTLSAAHRRLKEELGIETKLVPVKDLLYQARVSDDLIEHEYDHIFTGKFSGTVSPDPEEVAATKWISHADLEAWMKREPNAFTAWFPILLEAWYQHQGMQVAI